MRRAREQVMKLALVVVREPCEMSPAINIFQQGFAHKILGWGLLGAPKLCIENDRVGKGLRRSLFLQEWPCLKHPH